jgi:hypothetical protein
MNYNREGEMPGPGTQPAVRAIETEQHYQDTLRENPAKESHEYRPDQQELLREYEIQLQFLHRGCIVRVGCKSIAFETVESAMKEVNEYVNNTWEAQKKWREILK